MDFLRKRATAFPDLTAARLTRDIRELGYTGAYTAVDYISGLIGPGDRKSVQTMAAHAGDAIYDQLHHLVSGGVCDAAPLEAALLTEADARVGGDGA